MQLSRLAVPFFLIAAGYFFSRGAPPGEFWPRWWKYTRRLLPLVLAWSLIDGVFSLDWLRKTEAHGLSYLYWKLIAIPGFAIDHPELFLFRGTIGPLWFVFGLVYSLTALTIFRIMRLSSRSILVIGLTVYCTTLALGDYAKILDLEPWLHEHRGPFIAFAFVAIGNFLAQSRASIFERHVPLPFLFLTVFLMFGEATYLSMHQEIRFRETPYLISLIPGATALFIYALNNSRPIPFHNFWSRLGGRSMGIYLIHMPTIEGLASYQPIGMTYDFIFPVFVLLFAWIATEILLKVGLFNRFLQ